MRLAALVLLLILSSSPSYTAPGGIKTPGQFDEQNKKVQEKLKKQVERDALDVFQNFYSVLNEDSYQFALAQATARRAYRSATSDVSLQASPEILKDNLYWMVFERLLDDVDGGVNNRFEIASFLPRTAEEYTRVFGVGNVTSAHMDEMKMGEHGLSSLVQWPQQVGFNIGSIDDFKSLLTSTDASFVFLVGHNDDGYIATPSGGRIKITSAAIQCANAHVLCVFVSCEAGLIPGIVGPKQAITMQEAISSVRTAATILRLSGANYEGNIRDPFQTALDLASHFEEAHQSSAQTAVKGGAGLLLMVMLTGDDDDEQP